MVRGLVAQLPPLLLLPVVLGGCGDEVGEAADDACGPNGTLAQGLGAGEQCRCDEGFTAVNGTCVVVDSTTQPPDGEPESSDPDCGAHGAFNGTSCICDSGYTQVGLEEQRTCAAIPACQSADDGYEPNDEPGDATFLSEVEGPLYACPADGDWYVFPVTAGDRVSAEIRFDSSSVDLDLLLYGPSSRDPRAFSLGLSSSESASFTARADGTAGVYVMPYGIGEGSYQMAVEVQAGETPTCAGPGDFCRVAQDCCSSICHVDHCH